MIVLRFLSSIAFALFLIASSALFVIAGTILESKTTSHALAETWIYKSPIFHLLLSGFFINILFSALRRWPFKKKHIPFLITHLGLLMLISGVFIKSMKGIQGHVHLVEGSSTDWLVIPDQKAIWVEQKSPHKATSIPIASNLSIKSKLPIKLLSLHPHAVENYVAWQDEFSHPKLPWKVFTSNHEPLEQALNRLKKKQKKPFLLVHRFPDDLTTLVVADRYGERYVEQFRAAELKSWLAYDGGFAGYGLQAKIPWNDRKKDLIQQLRQSNSPLTLPLEIFEAAAVKTGRDFPKLFVAFLKGWADQGTWLYENPPSNFESILNAIDWSKLPSGDFKALYWISFLFKEEHFLEHLKKIEWPLIASLQNFADGSELHLTWMRQLYEIKEQLPAAGIPTVNQASAMLTALLRFYSIHYTTTPLAFEKIITLESALERNIEPTAPPLKPEEAAPLALVEWKGKKIPLVFDSKSIHLKWPAGDGQTMLKFQPHRMRFPYEIRLHRAQDVKYPGSAQTLSYECLISLTHRISGKTTKHLLKMNQVYETQEGFRFYLSGMGAVDNLGVRSAQLVINYDPAKYWLTYPGAVLVALGILLLFWLRNYFV